MARAFLFFFYFWNFKWLWPEIQLLLTSKTYIADISYTNYFVLYLFKKCDKIHNFMHYVQILLKDVIKKIRIWNRTRARVTTFTNHPGVTLMSWKLTWNVLKMSWKVHKGLYLFLLSNGLSSNLKILNTLAYI